MTRCSRWGSELRVIWILRFTVPFLQQKKEIEMLKLQQQAARSEAKEDKDQEKKEDSSKPKRTQC